MTQLVIYFLSGEVRTTMIPLAIVRTAAARVLPVFASLPATGSTQTQKNPAALVLAPAPARQRLPQCGDPSTVPLCVPLSSLFSDGVSTDVVSLSASTTTRADVGSKVTAMLCEVEPRSAFAVYCAISVPWLATMSAIDPLGAWYTFATTVSTGHCDRFNTSSQF